MFIKHNIYIIFVCIIILGLIPASLEMIAHAKRKNTRYAKLN